MRKESSELYEDPKSLQHDLAHLKDWLLKQPHIHGRTDDEFLLRFIRGCKYSLERAKEKIDTYYTMRTAIPEFFSNRDSMDPVMQECFRMGLLLPLGRDDAGRGVVLARLGPFDPVKISVYMGGKYHMMASDIMLEEYSGALRHGVVLIFDLKGTLLSRVAHYTPAICKKTFLYYQNALPARPKDIHVLNMPSLLEAFVSLTASIVKEKIRRRIIFHKDVRSLQETVPLSILPKEYGGTAGTLQEIAENWRHTMITYRDFLLEDEQYKVDESKRPGNPKTHEDLFGFEGSFRQLEVD